MSDLLWDREALQMVEELTKICPGDQRFRGWALVQAWVLPWINMNAGLVVVCKPGWLGYCPMGRICQFSLNPEKKYAVSDPRFWKGRDVTVT